MLKEFVLKNSGVVNVEWDPRISMEVPVDVKGSGSDCNTLAHYMLLVASITETMLTGRSENARALIIQLYDQMEEELLRCTDPEELTAPVESCPFIRDFGPDKNRIPEVIASVNAYVCGKLDADIMGHVEGLSEPAELVNELEGSVPRMGGVHVEKAWMYLNWCTRLYPDLGLFPGFSPKDLKIPLTSYIRDVVCCLGQCPPLESEWWLDSTEREQVRDKVTRYAAELFPGDPGKVSYPFYLLGRWIRGKPHSEKTLMDYLRFFHELYRETGTVPVSYDIVERKMSGFEEAIVEQLVKAGTMYFYESHVFNLPGGITYRPDFVLPGVSVGGRGVLLEPHGVWDYPRTRTVNIGGTRMRIPALDPEPSIDERRFVDKMRLFRERFGKDYHLVMIVPPQVKERVHWRYPEIFDELYETKDVPELLYKLKNGYKPRRKR